jgi:hypothetical protein
VLKRKEEELNETKKKENEKTDERSNNDEIKNNIAFLLCFRTYTLLNIDFFLMPTVGKD